VSWAINPNVTGMSGAQALLAFKSNGSVTIQTYNIRSTNFPYNFCLLFFFVFNLNFFSSS
jgi:hypothetical protein